MSRAAFQNFGVARETHTESASAKGSAWRADHRDSGENQVVPFHLDDCADDNEEIRRRRYSSSYSSCQDEDDRGARRRQAHKPSPGESDWDKASSQEPSSASVVDDEESDEEEPRRVGVSMPATGKARGVREEPESPRKGRRKSQQSDDDSHISSGEEKEEEGEAKPRIATDTTATAPSETDLSEISKLSLFPGSDGEALVQGHILRVKTMLGGSQYHFFIQNQLVLMAQKQLKNRTSNYHLFDMTRAVAGATKLTKKSGNYVGKLRANFSRRKYVLVSSLRRRTELGAVVFEPTTTSSEPRRLTAVLPPLSTKRREIEGLTVGDSSDSFSVLLDLLAAITDSGCSKSSNSEAIETAVRHSPISPDALQVFENNLPVFENGYYRLNFNGRVSVPSVKNFQLVARGHGVPPHAPPSTASTANSKRVVLQFGKVDDKKFHLDFRAPVTPIQAFALALAQFNY